MFLAAIAMTALSPVQSPPSDPFATCLVRSITDQDRTTLVRWIFAIYAAHDKVADMAKVTPAQQASLSKQAGETMNRLLTQDCRAEAVDAIRNSADPADKVLEKAFGEVGEVAVTQLMGDPKVERAMTGMLDGINLRAWSEVLLDAGIDPLTGKKRSPKK